MVAVIPFVTRVLLYQNIHALGPGKESKEDGEESEEDGEEEGIEKDGDDDIQRRWGDS